MFDLITVHEHTRFVALTSIVIAPGILGMVLLGVWDLARGRR